MFSRSVSTRAATRFCGAFSLALAVGLGACSADKTNGPGTPAPSTSDSSTVTSPTSQITGAPNGSTTTQPTSGPTGATSSTEGSGATGDDTTGPTGGSAGAGTSGGDSASSSGAATSGTQASAASDTGPQGSAPSGSSGEETSGPASTECTRELLDGLMDDYLVALSAGDPSSLPLADGVKFTENAEQSAIGSTAFWMNAGEAKYSQRALDTTACSVAAQAVIPEGTTDLPVGIRLKVEAGKLTEIETIVVRQGDYNASFGVPSEPADIITIADQIGWHDEVPEADRATREQLSGWIDKYFRAFPQGVCNVTTACRRLENGGGGAQGELGFSCSAGAQCSGSSTSGTGFEPRVIIVDEVRGIAAGFTIFDFQDAGHLDMHMMKMSGGEVHAVHALLRDTDGESGWE